MWAMGEPRGPIENGTTYIVRPFIAPRNRSVSSAFIAFGSRQLFVGPASISRSEQMKVRSSTRATSAGSERARKLLGRASASRGVNAPASTSSCDSRWNSSSDPSHHSTASGWQRAATRSEEHTSELQSPCNLVCRLLLEKKKTTQTKKE